MIINLPPFEKNSFSKKEGFSQLILSTLILTDLALKWDLNFKPK